MTAAMDEVTHPQDCKEVFISYVSEDWKLRDVVVGFLRYFGVSYYFDQDPANCMSGDWRVHVVAAAREAKLVLVICSKQLALKKKSQVPFELEHLDDTRKIVPLWFDKLEIPPEIAHLVNKNTNGVKFFETNTDAYVRLYYMLKNAGVALSALPPSSYPSGSLVRSAEKPGGDAAAKGSNKSTASRSVELRVPEVLRSWKTAETDCWLLEVGESDGAGSLILSGDVDAAIRQCAARLASQITFENLRLALVGSLAAVANGNNNRAAYGAMACIVAMQHSPGLYDMPNHGWSEAEIALNRLGQELRERCSGLPAPLTLAEAFEFEDETATIMGDNGGVAVDVKGHTALFAFGAEFVAVGNGNNILNRKILQSDPAAYAWAFTSLGPAAYLWRQAQYERVLRTAGSQLAEYVRLPAHTLHSVAWRILSESAFAVAEGALNAREICHGDDVCQQLRLAISLLKQFDRKMGGLDFRCDRLVGALEKFTVTIDETKLTPWLRNRVCEVIDDVEALGWSETADICCRIRRQVVRRPDAGNALAAYENGEFNRAFELLRPVVSSCEAAPDDAAGLYVLVLAELVAEGELDRIENMTAAVKDLQRRTGGKRDGSAAETMQVVVRRLALRHDVAKCEALLQESGGDGEPASWPELFGVLFVTTAALVLAGEVDTATSLLDRLPAGLAAARSDILMRLKVIAGDRLPLRAPPPAAASESVGGSPTPGETLCSEQFAKLYASADFMQRSLLRARVRCTASEMHERGETVQALEYLACVTEAVPNDELVQNLRFDCLVEWSKDPSCTPEVIARLMHEFGMDRSRKPVIDVPIPQPHSLPNDASPLLDREREAVLKKLKQLEAHDNDSTVSSGDGLSSKFENNVSANCADGNNGENDV